MILYRCKTCGAELRVEDDRVVDACPVCGAPMAAEAGKSDAVRVNVAALIARAQMALADGEFSRADSFCELILNDIPTCAEAYLYKLLAELRLPSRAALSEYRGFYDKNNNYRKAFRFGDEALRAELLAPMQATEAEIKTKAAQKREKAREDTYLRAKKMLSDARCADACYAAEKIFLSLGDYRDASAQAEACRARVKQLAEKRKEEQARAAAKRKKLLLRAVKIALIALAALLVLAVVATGVYLFGFRLAVPTGMCQDALSLCEEGKHEEALELLADAREKALFGPTKKKIDAAIKHTEKAKEEALAQEKRRAEIALAVEAAEALFAKGKFCAGITSLLVKNIPVSLTYDAEGATITQDGEPVQAPVQYREGRVTALAVAEREEYSFEKWELGAHAYEDAADVYSMTLCAVFSENRYEITYTGGGTADNPKGYSVTTPTFTLATPVREGYTFLGWTGTDLEEQTMEVTVEAGSTGNRQYTAHWQANIYHLTLDAAGGEIDVRELDVAFGSSFWITTPKRNGYTLRGWKMADGTDFPASNIWNIAEDVTLTAEWIKIDYAISYSLGGVPASNSNPVVYDVETERITLKDLSYPNCTFLGWYSDAAYTNRVTSIPKGSWGPKTLYAKWYIPTFNVILDLNGGYGISQQVITYSALDLPLSIADLLPQKDLHTFYYWAKDELDGVPVDTISACSDVLLVANYLPEGTEVQFLMSGNWEGWRCTARYWPTAFKATSQENLVFPKYHRLRSTLGGLYIDQIDIVQADGVKSISYSSKIVDVDCPSSVLQTVR